MKCLMILIALFGLSGCISPPCLKTKGYSQNLTNSIYATISIEQTEFDLSAGEEVNITFKVLNKTDKPVPYESLRDTTELMINGRILPESNFIFSNGPHPWKFEEYPLPPGKTYEFWYQMTSIFNKKGTYTVSWHGDHFNTSPIVFKITQTRKGDANH